MKRARDEESKAARRAAIVKGASELFELAPYEDLTMSSLARHVGLAKGTLYLYFTSKEELFLEILSEQLVGWLERVREVLAGPGGPRDVQGVAGTLAAELGARPTLLRLMGLQHPTLERGVDAKTSTRFRRRLRDALIPVGEALEGALPGLEVGAGFRALLWCQAAAVGVHQMANLPEPAVAATRALDLAMFRVDFVEELGSMLASTLRGAMSE